MNRNLTTNIYLHLAKTTAPISIKEIGERLQSQLQPSRDIYAARAALVRSTSCFRTSAC